MEILIIYPGGRRDLLGVIEVSESSVLNYDLAYPREFLEFEEATDTTEKLAIKYDKKYVGFISINLNEEDEEFIGLHMKDVPGESVPDPEYLELN